MCVVAKSIATNWIVYTNSCVPKHIIYQHYSHRKRNFLIAILKKKKRVDIRPLTFKTKIKEKTVLQKHMFMTLMGPCLIARNGVIYIIHFKKFQRINSYIGFNYKHFKKIGKKFFKTATEAYSVLFQTSKTKRLPNTFNGLSP